MKLVLMGPPGAGKGTQAEFIKSTLNIPSISTGSILRKKKLEDSALGRKLRELIDNGMFVPDDMIVEIVKERLKQDDCSNGYILDGFPRTIAQAEELDTFDKIDRVIFIEVSFDEIKKRMARRKICGKCGITFGANADKAVFCEKCGGKLTVREDDRPEAVEKRLEVYQKQTSPLIEYYKKQKKLTVVSGIGTVSEISDKIADALEIRRGGAAI